MNYRHKLLNQQNKNTVAKLEQEWKVERQNLQTDILNLQNSTDLKLLEQAQKKAKELEKLLNDTVALLGKEEIKNLGDIRGLLQGRSLKELVGQLTSYQQKVRDQDTALITLARQKIKGKKDAETLLNELDTKWSEKEIEWEKQQEQNASFLASTKNQHQEEIKKYQQEVKEAKSKGEREKEVIWRELTSQKERASQELKAKEQEIKRIEVLINSDVATLTTEIVQEKEKNSKFQELAHQIKEIINSRLVIFMGKEKVLGILEEIGKGFEKESKK